MNNVTSKAKLGLNKKHKIGWRVPYWEENINYEKKKKKLTLCSTGITQTDSLKSIPLQLQPTKRKPKCIKRINKKRKKEKKKLHKTKILRSSLPPYIYTNKPPWINNFLSKFIYFLPIIIIIHFHRTNKLLSRAIFTFIFVFARRFRSPKHPFEHITASCLKKTLFPIV